MATTIQILITKCAWFSDLDKIISNSLVVVKQEFTFIVAVQLLEALHLMKLQLSSFPYFSFLEQAILQSTSPHPGISVGVQWEKSLFPFTQMTAILAWFYPTSWILTIQVQQCMRKPRHTHRWLCLVFQGGSCSRGVVALSFIFLPLFCLVCQALILAKCFTLRQRPHTCLMASRAIANIINLNLNIPEKFLC